MSKHTPYYIRTIAVFFDKSTTYYRETSNAYIQTVFDLKQRKKILFQFLAALFTMASWYMLIGIYRIFSWLNGCCHQCSTAFLYPYHIGNLVLSQKQIVIYFQGTFLTYGIFNGDPSSTKFFIETSSSWASIRSCL